jgi:hypothetical protein
MDCLGRRGHVSESGRLGSPPSGLCRLANVATCMHQQETHNCAMYVLRQDHHSEEKYNGRDHLQRPWNSKCCRAFDEGAAIGNIEHDLRHVTDISMLVRTNFDVQTSHHDAPSNGPLLSADKTPSLRRWRNLRDVHRHLGRADANTEAIDDAAHDQHRDVLRCRYNDTADDPNHGADHDSFLAAKAVRDEA